MSQSITLTEAKSKFSELINRIIYNKEKIYISKKGRNVAVLVPLEEASEDNMEEGLILAKKGLPDLETELEDMEDIIYKATENDFSRTVDL